MPVEIRVPPLGESLVDAVVGQWLKQEGDAVTRGETVVELETDKVNLDVTAADDGVIARIDKHEGDTVVVGEVLGMVGTDAVTAANGASAPATAQPPAEPSPGTDPAAMPPGSAPAPVQPQETPAAASSAPASSAAPPAPAAPSNGSAPAPAPAEGAGGIPAALRAAPAVRRLAEEHHLDLNRLAGSGPGGRITREDVLAAAESGQPDQASPPPAAMIAPAPSVPAPASPEMASSSPSSGLRVSPSPDAADPREERVRLSRRRQTIATRLVQAQQTAAMLTTFNEVDMTAVMEVRTRRKEAFKERHGVGLGFMSFFAKAAIGALKAFPSVNAEIQGTELVLKHYYDIGVAVGVEDGLVVPVIRDADRKSFAQIEREIGELATKARDGKLALAELQGGTFTLTNGGVFGSLLSTPILNTPQVGILGMHAIQKRPVVRGDEIVIRPMMYLALSYDHRIVDGREAVLFLVRIKELIEDPESLLLEG